MCLIMKCNIKAACQKKHRLKAFIAVPFTQRGIDITQNAKLY